MEQKDPPGAIGTKRTSGFDELYGTLLGAELRDQVDAAKKAGDYGRANDLLHEEWRRMGASYLKTTLMGSDPIRQVTPDARNVSEEVARSFIVPEMAMREQAKRELLAEHEGLKRVRELTDGWDELFRQRNHAPLLKWDKNLPESELQTLRNQMVKEEIPEADHQFVLSTLHALDAEMKQIDEGFSIQNEPDLERIVRNMSTAADPFGPGRFTVGAPLAEGGSVVGRTLRAGALGAGEMVGEFYGAIGDGISQLGIGAIEGFDSEFHRAYLQTTAPSGWYQTRGGDLIHNGGKIPFMAGPYLSFKLASGASVDEIRRIGQTLPEARAWEQEQVRGAETYANAIANVMGGLAGFFGTGGSVLIGMGAKAMHRGAARLLTSTNPRTAKLGRVLVELGAPTIGTAMWEANVYGRQEGYGKAFVEGMKMGPVFYVAGTLGGRVGRLLQRKKMPARARRGVEGMFEGLVLSSTELPNITQSLWRFMQDPENPDTQRDWAQVVVGNMIGMGLFKAAFGRTPAETRNLEDALGPEGWALLQAREGATQARRAAVERADTPEAMAEVARRGGVRPETAGEYGRALRDLASGRKGAEERVQQLEQRLDVEEAGKDRTELERRREVQREVTPEEMAELARGWERMFEREGPQRRERFEAALRVQEERRRARQAERTQEFKEKAERHFPEGEKFKLREAINAIKTRMQEEGRTPETLRMLREAIEKSRGLATEGVRKFGEQMGEAAAKEIEAGKELMAGMMTVSSMKAGRNVAAEFRKGIADSLRKRHPEWSEERVQLAAREATRVASEKERARAPQPKKRTGSELPTVEEQFIRGEPAEVPPAERIRVEERKLKERRGLSIVDPLEDPRFMDLPPELQRRIMAAKTAAERSDIMEREVPERRVEERRRREGGDEGDERRFVRAEDVPEPSPNRPKSLDVQPRLQQEPVKGAKRVRAKDIITRMEGLEGDLVRVPIRKGIGIKGRLSTKGILGWYHRRQQQVRMKGARDIVVAAHEWSHAMEEAATRAGTWDPNVPAWWRPELRKVAETYPNYDNLSPSTQVAEGWAEYWAREMLADPRIPEEVPKLHAWLQNWISRPENERFRIQHDEIADLVRNYFDQGALGRLEASIFFAEDKPSDVQRRASKNWWTRFKEAGTKYFFDDIVELKKAQSKWLDIAGIKEGGLPISLNVPRLIDALRMTAHRQADEFLRAGTHDLAGNRTGESVEDVLADIGPARYREFVMYLTARRAANLIEQGFEMPLDKADYVYAIEQLESPQFAKGANRIREWANRLLDYMIEAGAITETEKARMVETNPVYLPFQRMLEGPRRHRAGRGVAERGTGIARMKGGQEELRDPIDALEDSTRSMITKAQQAMVMRGMYLQSKILPGMAGFVTEVPLDVEPRTVLIDRITKEIERLGEKKGNQEEAEYLAEQMKLLFDDPADALTFFFQKAVPSGSRPIVAYRPKLSESEIERMGLDHLEPTRPGFKTLGEEIRADREKLLWLEVDIDAYNTLMSIDAPALFMDNMPALLRGLIRGPARAVRFGATVLNPEFIVRNIFRDAQTGQLFTQAKGNKAWFFSGFGSLLAGAATRVKNTEGAQLYSALGLEGTTLVGTEIGREVRRGSGFLGLGGAIRRVAEFFGQPEIWLRQEEFDLVRRKKLEEGASEVDATLEAMLASKERTTNFTRAGLLSRQLNQLIPYFSPGLAGARKFWRVIGGAEGPEMQRQALIRGLLNLGGMSALIWALHGDEDWYQDLPAWRRVNYWTFKMPFTDQVVSIPKPFEPGIFFGTFTENVLQALKEHDPELAEETIIAFFGMHAVGFPWIPAPVLPMSESLGNYSFFFRREIVADWMQKSRLPEDQFTAYTTETFKWIGDMLNVSPARLEYVFSQYGGGLPRSVLRAVESITGVRKVDAGFGQIPALGTMFRQTEFKQSRAVQQVFDIYAELDQLAGSDALSPHQKRMRSEIRAARRKITENKRLAREGKLDVGTADERNYRIARRVVDRYERIVQ